MFVKVAVEMLVEEMTAAADPLAAPNHMSAVDSFVVGQLDWISDSIDWCGALAVAVLEHREREATHEVAYSQNQKATLLRRAMNVRLKVLLRRVVTTTGTLCRCSWPEQ